MGLTCGKPSDVCPMPTRKGETKSATLGEPDIQEDCIPLPERINVEIWRSGPPRCMQSRQSSSNLFCSVPSSRVPLVNRNSSREYEAGPSNDGSTLPNDGRRHSAPARNVTVEKCMTTKGQGGQCPQQTERFSESKEGHGRLLILQSGKVQWNVDEFLYNAVCTESTMPLCSRIFDLGVDGSGRVLKWMLTWAPRDHSANHYSFYLASINAIMDPNFQPVQLSFVLNIRGGKREMEFSFYHQFTYAMPAWGGQNLLHISVMKSSCRKDGSMTAEVYMTRLATQTAGPPLVMTLQPSASNSLEIALVSRQPRIFVLDNFLSQELCQKLIKLALPDLRRSKVAAGMVSTNRTSHGTFLTDTKERDPTVIAVESKIAKTLSSPVFSCDQRKQLRRSEALQVVRYNKGEFYNEHYDNKAGDASHRAATFMIYLTDVEAGGATYFPRAKPIHQYPSSSHPNMTEHLSGIAWDGKGSGLRIYPRRGRALLFWSRTSLGKEDLASVHAAEAVVEGEKWITTRWLQEE